MSVLCCTGYAILLLIIYKAVDWMLRRFYIGQYNERYILVTGCDTGFGNIAAKRFDKLGCHVFAGCYTEVGGRELRSQCSDKLQVVSLDVSNPESVTKAFDTVKSKLPPGKGLWGVVNNAGIIGGYGPTEWFSVDNYKNISSVNLYGVIDVTLTFLPLVKLARGRVVNTASIAGRFAFAYGGPYSVAKYGVEAFTDGLRRSLRPFGVKAVVIEPGAYMTRLTSEQNVTAAIDSSWNRAPQEAKHEYGEVYFRTFKDTGIKKILQFTSSRLDDVVDAYQHALFGTFPRARYVVGYDAKFVFLPLLWMPEWLSDWLLEKN